MAQNLPEYVDADRLAALETVLAGEFPTVALRRLAEVFSNVQPVMASVAFARTEENRLVVRGRVDGEVTAVCQRCLQPVTIAIAGEFEHLPEAEEMLEATPAGAGTLNLLALVEDEVLLASPMIPKHAAGECPAFSGAGSMPPAESVAKRENPFDLLATLRQNTGDKSRGTDAPSNPEE